MISMPFSYAFTLLSLSLTQGLINERVSFEESRLAFENDDGYCRLRYAGLELTDQAGAPAMPVKSVMIALPTGSVVKRVAVIPENSVELDCAYDVAWAQPPQILSFDPKPSVPADPAIYRSDAPYPASVYRYEGMGTRRDGAILELLVYPVQYRPQSKKIILHRILRIEVEYAGGRGSSAPGVLEKFTIAPTKTGPGYRDRSDNSYLIITEPPFDTVFQRLADWKTKKGVKAAVRNKSWIVANYPGVDVPARIRNYLIAAQDSSVEYVLLGGDVDIIPCRFAYAMTCSAFFYPGREDTLPCDLYYADLQGTWDRDGDRSYGEIEDSVDLYPDLAVGRAPVNTVAEARRFVDKVLTYEKNGVSDYFDNALFAAEILWQNPYTDQGVHKNKIDEASIPAATELAKLYQSLGNENKQSVMDSIRRGQSLINHDGHGWIDVLSVGGWPHRIYNIDFDTITNAPRYGILYSIGCWTAAFDSGSVGEAYVNSPSGGGVAYVGNSSYGWGSPGNPGFGYSDRFDSRFFYALYNEDNWHLGPALAIAKAHFVPFAREKNVYRWHEYQINLLGDPELPVWTGIPESLTAFHPAFVPTGTSRIAFTVVEKTNGRPVAGALVCLAKGAESYDHGHTDARGMVFLDATPQTAGAIELTVTAHNYFSVEKTIPVTAGAYPNFQCWTMNDMFGNADGVANPNEDVLFTVCVKNCGNAVASSIALTLRDVNPLTVILDSTAAIGSLNPGDSVVLENAFGVRILNAQNGDAVDFELDIDYNRQRLQFYPVIRVGTPVLGVAAVRIPGAPTMPGETESLYVDIANAGFGFGHATWARLTSDDPYVTVLADGAWYGEVLPESLKPATQALVVGVSASCPASHISRLSFSIHADNYVFEDTVDLLIGNTGFADDLESGSGLWTTGGTGNLWHLTTRNSFSPVHSWYCGDETLGIYNNNLNCYIRTVPFMVQANSLLRFRRQFSVPLYGTDGIYVIVSGGGSADTLDFIGTGGALKERGITSDWFEEKYSLDRIPAGDTVEVTIAFVSDNDGHTSEGFYIDDFYVEYVSAVNDGAQTGSGYRANALEICPNPARDRVLIKFEVAHGGNIGEDTRLDIFDACGRRVRSFDAALIRQNRPTGITWTGTDEAGRQAGAGIYFFRLTTAGTVIARKVVFLR